MSPSVDIDDDIFEYLKSQAEAFVDTPSTVLRRLLDIAGPAERPTQQAETNGSVPTEKPPAARRAKRSAKNSTGRTRAASGTLLPEQRYEMPLLRALVDAGGEAPYRDIVVAVGRELEDVLMPADHETLTSGGIRWHSRLQFVRLRLIERGELAKDAPRGVWRITDAGRSVLTTGAQS